METHKRKRVDEEKGRPNYSSRVLAQKIGMERLLRLSIMNYCRSNSDGMDVFDWKLSYEQRCVAFDTLIEKVNKWTQFAKQSGAIKSSDEEELIEEQRAEIENLKAEKKEMEVEIELLKEQQEDGIELIEEHRAEIRRLKAEHKEKIERLKKEQEDEIERMKSEMEVKIELLKAELHDKEESLEHTQDLNNILIAKERHHNDELQEVRKLLIR
ncbi:hypothetical protein MKW94_023679, partial [Papaver nudicaule]|nr:hypothetical protein [Papaver nudicaule]